MADEVRVVAILTTQAGRGDEVLALWPDLAAQVRAEEGCRGYDLYRVIGNNDRFIVQEQWASLDALATHGASPHMRDFGRAAAGILTGPAEVIVTPDTPAA
jgi:quinol monooxygenase YgiN